MVRIPMPTYFYSWNSVFPCPVYYDWCLDMCGGDMARKVWMELSVSKERHFTTRNLLLMSDFNVDYLYLLLDITKIYQICFRDTTSITKCTVNPIFFMKLICSRKNFYGWLGAWSCGWVCGLLEIWFELRLMGLSKVWESLSF